MASEPTSTGATAAAAAAASDDTQVTFNIKAANDQKFVLTLPLTTTTSDLKTKLSGPDYADIPPERIRLIYSGRVLKDADTLQAAKIKDGHTIHMVKGAASNARQAPGAQSGGGVAASPAAAAGAGAGGQTAASPAANVPTSFATGTGAGNPLAGLTGARYAGFANLPSASMFGADGGMGGPDPNELLRMLDDPNMLSQMSEMMNNPDFIRMMEQNPMLANNPQMRQIIRDPEMRRMMFNPQMIRMQLEMQRRMGGGMPGMGGGEAFPMPGATDTTPGQAGAGAQGDAAAAQTGATGGQNPAGQANPFASLFGGGAGGAGGAGGMGAQGNPFAAMMGGAQQPGTPAQPGQEGQQNGGFNLMQSMQALQALQGMGGGMGGVGAEGGGAAAGGAGGNPFASLFGPGFGAQQPQAPPDNRPPEERYAEQLRQLNDMGFFEFERNVQALRRSGGSVQGAIEYLLSNP